MKKFHDIEAVLKSLTEFPDKQCAFHDYMRTLNISGNDGLAITGFCGFLPNCEIPIRSILVNQRFVDCPQIASAVVDALTDVASKVFKESKVIRKHGRIAFLIDLSNTEKELKTRFESGVEKFHVSKDDVIVKALTKLIKNKFVKQLTKEALLCNGRFDHEFITKKWIAMSRVVEKPRLLDPNSLFATLMHQKTLPYRNFSQSYLENLISQPKFEYINAVVSKYILFLFILLQ